MQDLLTFWVCDEPSMARRIRGTMKSKHLRSVELTWGQRLKVRLDDMKMTQTQLAEKLGVEPSAVNHWISGSREPRRFADLEQIAAAVGWHPAQLLFGVTVTPMPPYLEDVRRLLENMEPAEREKALAVVRALYSTGRHKRTGRGGGALTLVWANHETSALFAPQPPATATGESNAEAPPVGSSLVLALADVNHDGVPDAIELAVLILPALLAVVLARFLVRKIQPCRLALFS